MNRLFDSMILPHRIVLLLFIWIIRSSCSFSHSTTIAHYRTSRSDFNNIIIRKHHHQQQALYRRQAHSITSTSMTSLLTLRGGQDSEFVENRHDEMQQQDNDDKNKNKMILYSSIIHLPSLGKFYSLAIQRAPILTKSVTAGFIFLLSDLLAQRLEMKQKQDQNDNSSNKIQWRRMIASSIVGLCYFGPAAHYWYEWIFRIIPGVTFYDTVMKALLGQLLFGPTFTCIFFASSLIQLNQFTLRNYLLKIKNDLPSAIIAGIGFWPFVDFISYSYIPPSYIPLFINMCSLVWTTYLALKSYAK